MSDYSLLLRQDKGSKLTIEEMDGNLLYLQNLANNETTPIQLTQTGAVDAVINNSIITGAKYIISGVHSALYGGTTVLLEGLTPTAFTTRGYGLFYNPNYANYGVWDSDNSYGTEDVVIYGGQVWINIGGATGSIVDFFTLDENWAVRTTEMSDYYIPVCDEITYDLSTDLILSRFEAISNNQVITTAYTSNWFFCGLNPIKVFRWGQPYNGEQGIGSCTINNSYCENLNMLNNCSMNAITMDNYSVLANVFMKNSWLEKITMNNQGQFLFTNMNQSSLYSMEISDDATIISCTMDNFDFEDSTLHNSSWDSCSFTNSYMYNCTCDDSSLNNLQMGNSSFDDLQFSNCYFGNNTFTNAGFYASKMEGSYLHNIDFENQTIEFLTMDGSELSFTSVGTYWGNIDFKGFSFNNSMGIENQVIRDVSYVYNTIKIQIQEFDFNGGIGAGAIGFLSLPFASIPIDFFCEKVLIDAESLVKNDGGGDGSGPDPVINIGFYSGNTTAILDDSIGNVHYLNNKVSSFDLSNGELSGVKSAGYEGTNTYLLASVSGNNIVSGNISMEITLKNLKYSYVND